MLKYWRSVLKRTDLLVYYPLFTVDPLLHALIIGIVLCKELETRNDLFRDLHAVFEILVAPLDAERTHLPWFLS